MRTLRELALENETERAAEDLEREEADKADKARILRELTWLDEVDRVGWKL